MRCSYGKRLTGVAHALPRFQLTAHSIHSPKRSKQPGRKSSTAVIAALFTISPSSCASSQDRIKAPAMSNDNVGSSQHCEHAYEDDLEDDLRVHQPRKHFNLHAESPQDTPTKELECPVTDDHSLGPQEELIAECVHRPNHTKHSEKPFIHEPLELDTPSMRLIELLPLDENGDISCNMRHIILRVPSSHGRLLYAPTTEPYMCLSYAWGPPDQTRWIKVNGKPFQVRTNLWKFLHTASRLRATEKHSHRVWHTSLWVDAICIDQDNSTEKNHQVQQMGRIYSNAAEVIAWLGDDDTLATLLKAEQSETIYPKALGIIKSPGKPKLTRQPEYYEALCNNAYWKRAWVVQEILHARRLFFLAKEVMMHEEDFKKILLRVPKGNVTELLNLLDYAAESSSDVGVPANLITNVELFCRKDCMNRRDRVYSLLSVSCDGLQLPVDYDCSLVDLVRSVLAINKRGVCFQSVILILQAIQLEQNLLDVDACVPLIAMRGSEMPRYPATCHRCGEDISTIRHKVSMSALSRSHYVCLHCNHFGTPRPSGVHEISHSGHLCVIQDTVAEDNCDSWHLFWAPLEGSEWQKLQGFKYVLKSKSGDLRKLILSLGLLCELESLVSRHHNEVSIRFSNERVSQYPAGTSNWEVVDFKKESPV
jgi:hypothetical protein